MIEREMDNRGSKSTISNCVVKEQRVDGSLCIFVQRLHIRCTLIDFERNYLVKTLSNQLNINKFSGLSVNFLIHRKPRIIIPKLHQKRSYVSTVLQDKYSNGSNSVHPFFITGFTDAEGCFMVSIVKNSTYRTG